MRLRRRLFYALEGDDASHAGAHEKNALLVNPENQFELADAIQRLIEDSDLRNRIGAQALADYNQHLGYDAFYARMTNLYDNLFNHH